MSWGIGIGLQRCARYRARKWHSARRSERKVVLGTIGVGLQRCECYRARRGLSARRSELDVVSWDIGTGCNDVRASGHVEALLRGIASEEWCYGLLG